MSFSVAHFYEEYAFEWYDEHEGPPILEKKSRLLAAVVQNQLGVLQDLLDSPEWYNVTDKSGLTLLQIAILRDNKEVFDYMMSITDFPIDHVNELGHTALRVALEGFVSNDIWMREHFAYELVKKGASINVVCFQGNSPLHCALERSYKKVAILLIQKEVDLNVPNYHGYIPLELALSMSKGVDEVVSALLLHGATPTVDSFECSVLQNVPFSVQEQLFMYIFDELSEVDMSLHVILKLAERRSPLFHELFNYRFRVTISDDVYPYFYILFSINIDYLQIVIDKFHNHIREAFAKVGDENLFSMPDLDSTDFMETLDVMLEGDLRSDVISIISATRSAYFFEDIITTENIEIVLTEIYCYLLSYGLNISEWDLRKIYRCFGPCELFTILLHMDINIDVQDKTKRYIPAALFYDVSMDLDQFFEHSHKFIWDANTVSELCSNFVHPQLKKRYWELVEDGEVTRIVKLPRVPLLLELARNIFRKYFIEHLQIKTGRKFYTLLNCLPISTFHKKILTYETKLYESILQDS